MVAFGPGLRLVLRLALILIGAWLVHAVVVLISVLRDVAAMHREASADLDALTDAEIGEAAPWAQPDARPLDDVRSALDLFEQRYREAVQQPTLRFTSDGGVEFAAEGESTSLNWNQVEGERLDLDQWRRARRAHGDAAL